jgi:hemoglobin
MNAETGKPLTPYDALGGREVIVAIVNRFYDLMETDPQYAELRAMHAADLGPMRISLAGWLSAWSGGPRDWFEQNPGKCVMSAHRGLSISRETARQWTDAVTRAIADSKLENETVAQMLAQKLQMMAQGMVASAT